METFSIEKLSGMLGKDRRTLAKILNQTKPDGRAGRSPRWSIKTCFNACVAHELRTSARTNKATDEHILLARERRRKIKLANDEVAGKLIPADQLVPVLTKRYSIIRELFLALPGAEADALSFGDSERRAAIETRLRDRIYDILTELSSPEEVRDEAINNRSRHAHHQEDIKEEAA